LLKLYLIFKKKKFFVIQLIYSKIKEDNGKKRINIMIFNYKYFLIKKKKKPNDITDIKKIKKK